MEDKNQSVPNAQIYASLCGMYLPHVFFFDWYLGALYEVSKPVFIWLSFMTTLAMVGIIFSIINNDFAGYVVLIVLPFGATGMMYLATPYNGMTKNMGFPHAFSMGFPVIYFIIRLSTDLGCGNAFFCEQITLDNKPSLFVYLIISCIVFGYSALQDMYDAYEWYIKGNQTVLRSKKTLKKLKDIGLLDSQVEGIQVIKIAHKKTDDNIDDFGYLLNSKADDR